MNISIIGTGYVGLVTGTCFAEMGNTVYCVDVDEAKIANLKAGVIPIYEPGLTEMVTRNRAEGRLRFATDITDCMSPDRVVIGAADSASVEVMKELYDPFVRNSDRFIVMDVRSAEMTKYASNAMLATRISYIMRYSTSAGIWRGRFLRYGGWLSSPTPMIYGKRRRW